MDNDKVLKIIDQATAEKAFLLAEIDRLTQELAVANCIIAHIDKKGA